MGGERRENKGRQGRGAEGREEREKGSEGIGKGREGKENGDRPPTIFGLKVALSVGLSVRLSHAGIVSKKAKPIIKSDSPIILGF